MFDLIKKAIEKHTKTYLGSYFIIYPGTKLPTEGKTSFIRLTVASQNYNEIKRSNLTTDADVVVDFGVFDKSGNSNGVFDIARDIYNGFTLNPIYVYDERDEVITTLRVRSISEQFIGFEGEYNQVNVTINLFCLN
ncbi:MAG: hypothetical protein AMQ22_00239 [Candidatus Methanofastidiosum methylothiophilum]|uniref:Uncharacterized protein n=1 Tax=Candidatus Methanofastidiosum methylothiophilum TaxID=1705564 RepID=A0A150J8Z7_9EURY|nr:MAG: hypothetical protein APG11_00806 [Candidatus Methanofastidiosum methylthiophilus]KYC53568.1 MAG: hypothetical protein AMQ22_00239 [Candidatus Methanofastidiosum methylthiophilus]